MKKLKVSQDDPLETRVHDLEQDVAKLDSKLRNAEVNIEFLRQRIAMLLPERHHCRFCKGLIHPLSEVCGNCGRALKVPENPKAGQPR